MFVNEGRKDGVGLWEVDRGSGKLWGIWVDVVKEGVLGFGKYL